MKTFFQLLLIYIILLSCPQFLFGQASDSALRLGVGINGLLSLNDASPVQLGLGNEFTLWIKKPLNKQNSLRFAVDYRYLGGFQQKKITIEERNYPREFQKLIRSNTLASLTYLDLNLSWEYQFKKDAPWTFGAGLRISRLLDWEGQVQETMWVAYNNVHITETSFGGGTNYIAPVNEAVPLEASNFNRMDFGICLSLSYRLLKGLHLKTGYYQGFNTIFDNAVFADGKHRISSLSIGLSARLK